MSERTIVAVLEVLYRQHGKLYSHLGRAGFALTAFNAFGAACTVVAQCSIKHHFFRYTPYHQRLSWEQAVYMLPLLRDPGLLIRRNIYRCSGISRVKFIPGV